MSNEGTFEAIQIDRLMDIVHRHLDEADRMRRYCAQHEPVAGHADGWAARAQECREILAELEAGFGPHIPEGDES